MLSTANANRFGALQNVTLSVILEGFYLPVANPPYSELQLIGSPAQPWTAISLRVDEISLQDDDGSEVLTIILRCGGADASHVQVFLDDAVLAQAGGDGDNVTFVILAVNGSTNLTSNQLLNATLLFVPTNHEVSSLSATLQIMSRELHYVMEGQEQHLTAIVEKQFELNWYRGSRTKVISPVDLWYESLEDSPDSIDFSELIAASTISLGSVVMVASGACKIRWDSRMVDEVYVDDVPVVDTRLAHHGIPIGYQIEAPLSGCQTARLLLVHPRASVNGHALLTITMPFVSADQLSNYLVSLRIHMVYIPVARALNISSTMSSTLNHLGFNEELALHYSFDETIAAVASDLLAVNIGFEPDWVTSSVNVQGSRLELSTTDDPYLWRRQRSFMVDESKNGDVRVNVTPSMNFVGKTNVIISSIARESNVAVWPLMVDLEVDSGDLLFGSSSAGMMIATQNILELVTTAWWHHAQGPTLALSTDNVTVYEDEYAEVEILILQMHEDDMTDPGANMYLELLLPAYSGLVVEGYTRETTLNGTDMDDGMHRIPLPSTMQKFEFKVQDVHSRHIQVQVIATARAFKSSNQTIKSIDLEFLTVAKAPTLSLTVASANVTEDESFTLDINAFASKPSLRYYVLIHYSALDVASVDAIRYDKWDNSSTTWVADGKSSWLTLAEETSRQIEEGEAIISGSLMITTRPKFSGPAFIDVGIIVSTEDVTDPVIFDPACSAAFDDCIISTYGKSVVIEHKSAEISVAPRAEAPHLAIASDAFEVPENEAIRVDIHKVTLLDQDGSEYLNVDLVCDGTTNLELVQVNGIDAKMFDLEEDFSNESNFDLSSGSTVFYNQSTLPSHQAYRIAQVFGGFNTSGIDSSILEVTLQPRRYLSGQLTCTLIARAFDHAGNVLAFDIFELPFEMRIQPVSSGVIVDTSSTSFASTEDKDIRTDHLSVSLLDQDGSESLWVLVDFGDDSVDVDSVVWMDYPVITLDTSTDGITAHHRIPVNDSKILVLNGANANMMGTIDIQPKIGFSGTLKWTVVVFSVELAVESALMATNASSSNASMMSWIEENIAELNATMLPMTAEIEAICHDPVVQIRPESAVTQPLLPVPVSIVAYTPDVDGSEVLRLEVVVNKSVVSAIESSNTTQGSLVGAPGDSSDGVVTYTYLFAPSGEPFAITLDLLVVPDAMFVGLFTVRSIVQVTELETGETKSREVVTAVIVAPAEPIVQPTTTVLATESTFARLPFTRVDREQEVVSRDHLVLYIPDRSQVSDVYVGVRRLAASAGDFGAALVYSIPYEKRHVMSVRPSSLFTGYVTVYFIVSTVSLNVEVAGTSYPAESDGIAAVTLSILVRPTLHLPFVDVSWFENEEGGLHSPGQPLLVRMDGVSPIDSKMQPAIGDMTARLLLPSILPVESMVGTIDWQMDIMSMNQHRFVELASSPFVGLDVIRTAFVMESSYTGVVRLRSDVAIRDISKQQQETISFVLDGEVVGKASLPGLFESWTDVASLVLNDDEEISFHLLQVMSSDTLADLEAIGFELSGEPQVEFVEVSHQPVTLWSDSGTHWVVEGVEFLGSDDTVRLVPRKFVSQEFSFTVRARSSRNSASDVFAASSVADLTQRVHVVILPKPNVPRLLLNDSEVGGMEESEFNLHMKEVATPDQDGSEVVELEVVVDTAIFEMVSIDGVAISSESSAPPDGASPITAQMQTYKILTRDAMQWSSVDHAIVIMPRPDIHGVFSVEIVARSLELSTGESVEVTKFVPVTISPMPTAEFPYVEMTAFTTTIAENESFEVNVIVGPTKPSLRYTMVLFYPVSFVHSVDLNGWDVACQGTLGGQMVCMIHLDEGFYPALSPLGGLLRLASVSGKSGCFAVEASVFVRTEDIGDAFFEISNPCVVVAESMDDILSCRSFRERNSLLGVTHELSLTIEPRAVAPVLAVSPTDITVLENEAIDVEIAGMYLSDLDGSEEMWVTLECPSGTVSSVVLDHSDAAPLYSDASVGVDSSRYLIRHMTAEDSGVGSSCVVTLQPREYFSGSIVCTLEVLARDSASPQMIDEDVKNTWVKVSVVPVPTRPTLGADIVTSYAIFEDGELVSDTFAASLVDRDGSELLGLVFHFEDTQQAEIQVEWLKDNFQDQPDRAMVMSIADTADLIVVADQSLDLMGKLVVRPRVGYSGTLHWRVTAFALEKWFIQSTITSLEVLASSIWMSQFEDDLSGVIWTGSISMTAVVKPISHVASIHFAPTSLFAAPVTPMRLAVSATTPDVDGSEVVVVELRLSSNAVNEIRDADGSSVLAPKSSSETEVTYFFRSEDFSTPGTVGFTVFVIPKNDFLGIFMVTITAVTTELETNEQVSAVQLATVLVMAANPEIQAVPMLHSIENAILRLPFERLDKEHEVESRENLLLYIDDGSQVNDVFVGLRRLDPLQMNLGIVQVFAIPYEKRHAVSIRPRRFFSGFIHVRFVVSTRPFEISLGQILRLGDNVEDDGTRMQSLAIIVYPSLAQNDLDVLSMEVISDGMHQDGMYKAVLDTQASAPEGSMRSMIAKFQIPLSSAIDTVNSSEELAYSLSQYCDGRMKRVYRTFQISKLSELRDISELALRSGFIGSLALRAVVSLWDVAQQHSIELFRDITLDAVSSPDVASSSWWLDRASVFNIADDAVFMISLGSLGFANALTDIWGLQLVIPTELIEEVQFNNQLVGTSNQIGTVNVYDMKISKADLSKSTLTIRPKKYASQIVPFTIKTIASVRSASDGAVASSAVVSVRQFAVNVYPVPNAPVIILDSVKLLGIEEMPIRFIILDAFTPDQDGSEIIEVSLRIPQTAIQTVQLNDQVIWMPSTPFDSNATSIILLVPATTKLARANQQAVSLVPQLDYSGSTAVEVIVTSIETATNEWLSSIQRVTLDIAAMPRAVEPSVDVGSSAYLVQEDQTMSLFVRAIPQGAQLQYKLIVLLPTALVRGLRDEGGSQVCVSSNGGTPQTVCLLTYPGGVNTMSLVLEPVQHVSGIVPIRTGVLVYTNDIDPSFFASECFASVEVVKDVLACRSLRERKSLLVVERYTEFSIDPRATASQASVMPAVLALDENTEASAFVTNVSLVDRDGSEKMSVSLVCDRGMLDQVRVEGVVRDSTSLGAKDEYALAVLTAGIRQDIGELPVTVRPRAYYSGPIACVIRVKAEDTDPQRGTTSIDITETSFLIQVRAVATQPVVATSRTSFYDGEEDRAITTELISASLVDRDGSEMLCLVVDLSGILNAIDSVKWLGGTSGAQALITQQIDVSYVVISDESQDVMGTLVIQPRLGFSGPLQWYVRVFSVELSSLLSGVTARAILDSTFASPSTGFAMMASLRAISHKADITFLSPSLVTKPLIGALWSMNASTPDRDGSEVLEVEIALDIGAVLEVRVRSDVSGTLPAYLAPSYTNNGQAFFRFSSSSPAATNAPYELMTSLLFVPRAEFIGLLVIQVTVYTTELENMAKSVSSAKSTVLVVPVDPIVRPSRVLSTAENRFVRIPFQRQDSAQEVASREHLVLYVANKNQVDSIYAGYSRLTPLAGNLGVNVNVYAIPYTQRHAITLRPRQFFVGYLSLYFVVSTVPFDFNQPRTAYALQGDGIAFIDVSLSVYPIVISPLIEVVHSPLGSFAVSSKPLSIISKMIALRDSFPDKSTSGGMRAQLVVPNVTSIVSVSANTSLHIGTANSTQGYSHRFYQVIGNVAEIRLGLTAFSRHAYSGVLKTRWMMSTWNIPRQRATTYYMDHQYYLAGVTDSAGLDAIKPIASAARNAASLVFTIPDDQSVTFDLVQMGLLTSLTDLTMVQVVVNSDTVDSIVSQTDSVWSRAATSSDGGTVLRRSIWKRAEGSFALSRMVTIAPLRYRSQTFSVGLRSWSTMPAMGDQYAASSSGSIIKRFQVVVLPKPNPPLLLLNASSISTHEDTPAWISIVEASTPDRDGSEVIEIFLTVTPASILRQVDVNGSAGYAITSMDDGKTGQVRLLRREAAANVVTNMPIALLPRLNFAGTFDVNFTVRSVETATSEVSVLSQFVIVVVAAAASPPLLTLESTLSSINQGSTFAPLRVMSLALMDVDGSETLTLSVSDLSSGGKAIQRVETALGAPLQAIPSGGFSLAVALTSPPPTLRLFLNPSWYGPVTLLFVATATESATSTSVPVAVAQATTSTNATLQVLPIADKPIVAVENTREKLGEWLRVGIGSVVLADPTKSSATSLSVYLLPRAATTVRYQVMWQSMELTLQSVPSVSSTSRVFVVPAASTLRDIMVKPLDTVDSLAFDVVAVATVAVSSTVQQQIRTTTLTFASVRLSGTTFSLKEGTTSTMTLSLLSAPVAPVTITFASSLTSKAVAVPSSVTFAVADWSTARTVQIQAINNFLEDPDFAVVLTPTITTTDAIYAGVSIDTIAVQVLNDDLSSVVVFQKVVTTLPSLVVAEGRVFSDEYSIVVTAEPTADVVVTLSVSLPQMVVDPTSITFTATNWNSARKIVVNAEDNFVRENDHVGQITHKVASADKLYQGKTVATLNVKIVETKDTTPPPKLVSAKFSNTAVGLIILFDRAVHRAGMKYADSTFACSVMFDLPSDNSYGTSPSCTWQTSDISIRFLFGRGVSVVPGASLILRGGLLKSTADAELATVTTTLVLSAPDVLPLPVALVNGATSLGTCDDLTLDGSGSSGGGGRMMTYKWVLLESTGTSSPSIDTVASVLSQAATANSASLRISASALEPDATYTFVLQVRNFFGASASSGSIFVRKAAMPLPIVSIQGGGKQEVYRAKALQIGATAENPTCNAAATTDGGSSTTEMTFAWQQVQGDLTATQFKSTSVNPRVLRLPVRTLTVGVKYVFQMFVAMAKNTKVNNTASVEITVLPSALSAAIAGGDRSYGVEQDLVLDASKSSDPDDLTNAVPMAFTWTCLMHTGATGSFEKTCVAADNSAFALGNVDKPTVPANTLNPNIYYQFTVTVTKDTRSASASVVYFFKPGSPPTVSIEPLTVSKVNVNDRTVLKSTVTSKLPITRVEWTLVGGSAADQNAIFAVPRTGRRTMVLKENSLTPGVTYQFQLTVEDSVTATSTATISVTANAPPTSGTLVVTPTKGYALDETFAVQCSNWVDEDLPLRYTYRYIKGSAYSGGAEITMGSASLDPVLSSIFALGGGDNTTITVVAYIQDALGAVTRVFKEIVVEEKIVPAAEQAAYLASKTDAVLSNAMTGDPSKLLNVINALGDLINGVDETVQATPTPTPAVTPIPGATKTPTSTPQIKLKSCPTSNYIPCASNGECIREPASCPETNLACVTYCKCSDGYYGDNCAMNQAQYDAKRAALGSLISAMATSAESIDTSDVNAVEQKAASIATLTKSASILDEKSQALALNLVDNIMSAPVLSTSAKSAVGNTISNLLDTGSKSSSSKPSTKASRRLEQENVDAQDASGGSGSGIWQWIERLTGSSATASGSGTTASATDTSATDPYAKEKERLSQIQGTIGKLQNALLASAEAGEDAVTLISKNLKIVGTRDKASALEGVEVQLPLTDAEIAANYTPPSTTIPKGFSSFIKAQVAARRRRLAEAAIADEDDDPTVDVQSTLFAKNPYSFSGTSVNSPVMSVKVRQGDADIEVNGLTTPFRFLLRNIAALPPSTSSSSSGNGSVTAQVFTYFCLNGTRVTQFFNCTDVNEIVSVDCDGTMEGEGNITCPARKSSPICRYWDTTNSSWSSEGCTTVGTTDDGLYTICECTHLTDFSTEVEQALSLVATHFKNVLTHQVTLEDVKKNTALLLVMGGFFILYLVGFLYVSRWDRHDRLIHLRQKRHSIQETKHIKLSSPFQEPEYLHAVGWRAKGRAVARSFWKGIKENHKILSIIFKYDEHFTRSQRLTVVFTVIMSQMFTNAGLYQLKHGPKTVGSAFVSGLLSFLFMIPVTIAFMLMFKKAGRKQKYIVRYRVEDIEGNVAEVETDAYGRPKEYAPVDILAIDLAAIANCVEVRRLQRVAEDLKRFGLESRVGQVCRGLFLALYDRDAEEEPPESTEEDNDPLKGVLVKIKTQLEQDVLMQKSATPSEKKSVFGGLTRKKSQTVLEASGPSSRALIPATVVEGDHEGEDTSKPNAGTRRDSGPTLEMIPHERTVEERRILAMNQLLLMLAQGGGETVVSNMLKFDPLTVSPSSGEKIMALCESFKTVDEGDEGAEDDDSDEEERTDTLVTLQDWLMKCDESCKAQQSDAKSIAAKAKAELERTENQLRKLQQAIGSQFEKRLSEVINFAETMGTTAMENNARMVQSTTETVQAARRRTTGRLRRKTQQPTDRAAERRVTVTIKQQKRAILQANQEQLRERRRTVKEAQKIVMQERKRIQREAKREMQKVVMGLKGIAKMKKKMQLYMEARTEQRLKMMPLHERQIYEVEQERLSKIKRTSRLLYNHFLRRQPAKVARPLFPEWVVYVSYVICFFWCVWCAYFVVMFAFTIGQVESQLWIGSLLMGMAMTHVVSDPLKIFFRMGVMPLVATSVLAGSGLFGAMDSTALAISTAVTIGASGVAHVVAKKREEKQKRKRIKASRLVPTDEPSITAQAMAIVGQMGDDLEDKGTKDKHEEEEELPPLPCHGSFTDIITLPEKAKVEESYAQQRVEIKAELAEEAEKEKQVKSSSSQDLPKLVVTKGPPVQLIRPPEDQPSGLLAHQSSQVLKDKPSSVFAPSQQTRKPPKAPVLLNPPPIRSSVVAAGSLVQSIKSGVPAELVSAPIETCECGDRVKVTEMAAHKTSVCSHRLVPCRAGCGLYIQARSRNGHELSQCRLVMCSCGKMVLVQSLEVHQQCECRNKLVTCRLECGASMPSHQRERHERHECSKRVTTCLHCGIVQHASDLTAHMTNDCEVHRANAAVHHAVRTAFAPPPFVPSSPQKLNPTAIRGSPIQPLTTGPRGTLMRGPPLPVAPPTQIPGVVSEGSPEKQKLEALREKVLARRPPTLQTLAPSSPPRRPAEESGAPAIDTSDMSPTRRKMLLRGPNAMMLAPIAPPVLSPREDEVLAAAAGVDQTTVEAMTLDSEEDVQAISRLVFEVQQEQEETKPRRPRGRE